MFCSFQCAIIWAKFPNELWARYRSVLDDESFAFPALRAAPEVPVVTEDEARMARVDAMIAEMEASIDEARKTTGRMTDFLREMGVESETALRDMMRSEQCSPALRAMMEEDMAKLDRELMEAERNLMAESGHHDGPKPHRKLRRRMTRI